MSICKFMTDSCKALLIRLETKGSKWLFLFLLVFTVLLFRKLVK